MKTSLRTACKYRVLLLTTALFLMPSAQALAVDHLATPGGETVVAGAATFDRPAAGQLDVNQTTNRAIINWDHFDIGKDAATRFNQPGTNSLAVNRVTGAGDDPTKILGRLEANGRVMVLDRNGVLFGKTATVDVGGIIASTGDVSNADVTDGNSQIEIFDADQGFVENRGQMTIADAGLAALVAPIVRHSGVINAKLGRVSLASGSAATLDLFGDNLITLAVDGDLEHALVEHRGKTFAEAGNVQITTDVAQDVVDNSINMKGIIDVSSFSQKAGKIVLSGAQDATVNGKLLAGGEGGGGDISVDAKDIGIKGNAVLSTDTHFIGGGGTITLTAPGSIDSHGKIIANAEEGGGTVIIHAGDNVGVTGKVEARATGGGSGGLIDIRSGGDETRIASKLNAGGIDGAGRINLVAANILNVTDDAKLFVKSLSTGPGGVIDMDGGEVTANGAMNVNGKEGGGVVRINSDSFVHVDGKTFGRGETIGTGGQFLVDAGGDVVMNGRVDLGGASGGGVIDVDGDHITVRDLRADAVRSDFPDIMDPADGGLIDLNGASHVTLDGRISAQGGEFGGDGGTVNFSTPNTVTPGSVVIVSAPNGNDGEFNH